MRRTIIMVAALATLATAACATQDDGVASGDGPSGGATAEIRNAAGQVVGTATAAPSGDGISVRIQGTGLPAGAHGAHVHTTGACDPPDFQTAGGHWNPTGHQHGKDNPAGMHKGDLPNITIGADGRGTLEYRVAGATISGGANALLDADGAAIVIHAQPDDYKTDPSGNSGGRIACGIFR